MEVRRKPFRIDSKLFTLGFDGGRADSYHIMETKGRFQGSVWLGIKGLQWTLGELRKLQHDSPARSGIFQFQREGYRTLEFSCLSNRGGRFVELSEYHGGKQRGSIRIPEGRRGQGWTHFVNEIQEYYLDSESAKAPPKRDEKPRVDRLPAPETQSLRNGRRQESRQLRRENLQLAPQIKQRESRDLGWVTEVKNRVTISTTEPRPTRSFKFQWRLGPRSIRITKVEGQARSAKWVDSQNGDGPLCGPHIDPPEVHRECTEPHFEPEVDEVEDGEIVTGVDFGDQADVEIGGDIVKGVSPGEATEDPIYAPPVVEEPRDIMDLALIRVDLAEEIQVTAQISEPGCFTQEEAGSWLPVLESQDQIEVVHGETEPLSPMICDPLAVIAPPMVTVAPGKPDSDRSTWVNQHYRGLCELVGFPLDSHEKQCLALLRRIEASRSRNKSAICPRKLCSGIKGARELRNLVSTVNYEGRQRECC